MVFIPSNLDIENHLEKFHPHEIDSFCLDKLKYIIGLISSIPSNNKLLKLNQGFVPVHAATLQNNIKDYRVYLDYLLRTNILQTDHFYIEKSKSRGYRFAEEYNTILKPESVQKYTIRKLISENTNPRLRKRNSKYSYLSKWFNPDLQIDVSAAYDYLADQFRINKNNTSDYQARRKYIINRLSVDRLANQDYYFLKDTNVGRLHTNLTNLKSPIRNFISYAGNPLVSVDIRNSQPFLCNTFVNANFYLFSGEPKNQPLFIENNQYFISISELSKQFNFNNINSTYRLSEIVSFLTLGKTEHSLAAVELQRYLDLTASGRLYQYIQSEFKEQTGIEIPLGKKLKEVMFTVMFTDNRYIGQKEAEPKRVFKTLFPYMYDLFALIKKGDASTLPRLLQSIEAKIILDRVCYRISVDNPYLPIFTIHDSVTCPVGFEDYVATVIREEMVNAIGLSPSLKYEYWTPDVLQAELIHSNPFNP